jgi:hypothetical protein
MQVLIMAQMLNAYDDAELVKDIILRKGYATEHNYYNYIYSCDFGEEPLFFKISDDEGILTFYYAKTSSYRIFSPILADASNRLNCLIKFLEYAFANNVKKVEVEAESEFREEILKYIKSDKRYKARAVNTIFTWPVFKMNEWNGDLMQRKDWKDIRYYWNKYFREHKVEFKDASEIDKDILKGLVLKWKEQRTGKRVTFYKYYLNIIENGFKGFNTRIMIVDGNVAAMTAGFKVPNKNYYYSAIGIYSRDIDRTGEVANMDDLIELKKKGYEFVDFGGGEKELTDFKMKFKPTYTYKTYMFNIVENKKK